jgi:hypothetical protein
MPHYKNGREVKVGDKIIGKNEWSGVFTGMVVSIFAGASTCNISYIPTGTIAHTATTSDCFHEEDVQLSEATKADGVRKNISEEKSVK